MVRNTEHAQEPNGDTPIWARVVYRYGVPAAIALYLVYFFTIGIAGDVSAMRVEHQELRFYLRAICLNTADTDAERSACLTGER